MSRSSTRRAFLGLSAATILALRPSRASAAPSALEARVTVDRARLQVGEELVVKLQVTRQGSGIAPDPELPENLREGFDVLQCVPGVSTNVDMFRGTRTQARSLRCVLSATKPGEYSIAFVVSDGNRKVRSNIVKLQVAEAGATEPVDPSHAEPTEPRGDVFLWASVDKAKAYVGEQITYALDIYEARRFLDPHLSSPPTFRDFFSEELEVPEPRMTEVGGVPYRVRPGLRRALFPQRAGTASIGAAEIAVGLRRREVSAPIDVEVLPLPAEGQPRSFSPNNVGRYEISAELDRASVKLGEPLKLIVTIEGTGNIDVVEPAAWPELQGIRRYDPKIETEGMRLEKVGGRRTYEFLLVPERPGTLEIPPHTLAFFDPEAERYEVVQTEPLSIEVQGDPSQVASAEPSQDETERMVLAPVIQADALERHGGREHWLDEQRWTYGMLAVPVLAALSVGSQFLWRRFGPDEVSRAHARTRLRRREQVDQAEAALEEGQGFHAAISSLLHELAVDRGGPEAVGLARPQLVRLLERRGVERQDLRKLEALLEQCDAARFASQIGTVQERRTVLDDTLDLVHRSSLSAPAKGGST